ncbi:MAG: c-type cytochrome [Candidatus Eisenbacteria bacterium]|nr:c-type cytochrome [Candidatus Eisenbacteria bacterium]
MEGMYLKQMSHPRPGRLTRGLLAGGVGLLAVASVAWPQPSGAAAAPNPVKGKVIFTKTCVACHGEKAQGKRDLNSPALHTQEPWYLAAQLQKFRSGLRGVDPKDAGGLVMRPMALSLPDEQAVLDVAAYVSSIEGPPATPEVKGDAQAGAATFIKVCAACHGDGARGRPDLKTPALVGQNDWYVVLQLQKFKQGLRGADLKDATGAQMRAMALTLTSDVAMKDVAAYIARLK